ncbi:DUF4349 domain-containing protein [Candidatus Woesearchaeota archaeon]|nr:DUF4349 domain-containing protein [Candidatus Woesearchaeota archaeon]
MNKYIKWGILAFMIFAVVFAIGCTKNVSYDNSADGRYIADDGEGVVVSKQAPFAVPAKEMRYDLTEDTNQYQDEHIPLYYDPEPYVQIIRTASMNIEVDDFFLAAQKVEAYARKYGGYVSNSDTRADHNNIKRGTLSIRVPEIHFDAALAELSWLGEIKSRNLNGMDVTEEHIDIQARITNSQTHEEMLIQMYDNATDIDDMLQMEKEVSRVREQIERMQGQLIYLNNRVDMSTITVSLYEPIPVVKEWGVWKSVKNALNHSLATLRWMIEVIGWLLPLILAGLIVWIIIRSGRKKPVKLKKK